MIVLTNCNEIIVATSRDFKRVDELNGHTGPVLALDVSLFTADIISYSTGHLILHRLINREQSFQDFSIRTAAPKWMLLWKIDMLLRIKILRFSTIGDFFLATGKNLVNIWKRDKVESFNSEILLTRKENL